MGTSMESVQNAYRGFSRGNFTMLDNLALGFAGTKEGMQDLLSKAQEISGFEYNIDSYADIVQAIHVVQEEMGITGTTQKEAEGTITGSLASVKSAWDNLMVGLVNGDSNLDSLIDNLVGTVSAMADNIVPVAEKALLGISTLVEKLVPIISEKLPEVIDKLLPVAINTITSLFRSLAKALPGLVKIIVKVLPKLWDAVTKTILDLLPELLQIAVELITTLAKGLGEALPTLIPAIVDIIIEIVNILTDPNNLGLLVDASIAIIIGLADGLIEAMPRLLEAVPLIVMNLVQALIENAPKLLVATLELLVELGEYIWIEFPKQITSLIPKLFIGICEGVTNAEENLADSFYEVFMAVSDVITGFIDDALQWGKDLIDSFVKGITGSIDKVKKGAKDVANTVKDFLGFSEPDEGPLSNFHTYAPDMIDLFVKGINENVDRIGTAFTEGLDFSKSMARAEMPTIQAKPVASTEGANITIPVYIGQDKIDEIVVNSINEYNFRTGGR